MLGPTGSAVLHLHPSLRCNLSCRHCYSNSSPHNASEVPLANLQRVLDDARELGYSQVAISGGEPFVYPHLAALVRHAAGLGYRVSVATNGHFLKPEDLQKVAGQVSALAVSIDGIGPLHDYMRDREGAFERVVGHTRVLRESMVPFGFIHTVTRASLSDVAAVAALAAGSGASFLQLHPLEHTGRGADTLTEATLGQVELQELFLAAHLLRVEYEGRLQVHLDLLHRSWTRAQPDLIYGNRVAPAIPGEPASELGVLVVEADGAVVPVSYGFSRAFAIGNINEHLLRDSWPAFRHARLGRFYELCGVVWQDIEDDPDLTVFNWHERVCAASQRSKAAGDGRDWTSKLVRETISIMRIGRTTTS